MKTKIYFKNLINELEKNNTYDIQLLHIINPFSLYFLCDHFIGKEAHRFSIPIPKDKNNILISNDLSLINDYDIVHVEVYYFKYFSNEILEKINKKIILTTGQWNKPQINISDLTEKVLNHPNIVLWISQNPIYPNSKKYIAFPYGIMPKNLNSYSNMLLKNIKKNKDISFLPIANHTNKCREQLPKLAHINIDEYYNKMAESKFIISPIGDRDDCYRHYESIGLGSIPVSNINILYKNIFGKNMYYTDIEEMVNIINTKNINTEYIEPNKDLICFFYHRDKILHYINKLKKKQNIFKTHSHKTRKQYK